MRAHKSFLALCCYTLSSVAAGDQVHRVSVEICQKLPHQYETDFLPIGRRLALAKQAQGPTGDEAKTALTEALASVRNHLTVEIPEPTRAATWVRDGEDIVVAEWPEVPSRRVLHPVLLWDDSTSQTIVFEFGANRIASPRAVQQLIEEISKFDNNFYGGTHMYFQWPPGKEAVLSGYSLMGHLPQFDLPGSVLFSAVVNAAYAYLSVRFRPNLDVVPIGRKYIKERFPPLKARVSSWSKDQLLAEVGKPTQEMAIVDPPMRDQILIDELVTREDFTPFDFKTLLDRVPSGWYFGPGANYSVVAALKVHRAVEFEAAIRAYLNEPSARFDGILGPLAREPALDLEDLAIACIEQNKRAGAGCIVYLGERGKTERAYLALKKAVPAPAAENLLQTAIVQVAGRLR